MKIKENRYINRYVIFTPTIQELFLNVVNHIHNQTEVVTDNHVEIASFREKILDANGYIKLISQASISMYPKLTTF
jgi:Ni,Fe-hydrogenase III large subunit